MGIGTTAPDYKLGVFTDALVNHNRAASFTTQNDWPLVSIRRTPAGDGDILGALDFRGFKNSIWQQGAAVISKVTGSSFGLPAELSFHTNDGGFLYQRMTITRNGTVGIGNVPGDEAREGLSVHKGNDLAVDPDIPPYLDLDSGYFQIDGDDSDNHGLAFDPKTIQARKTWGEGADLTLQPFGGRLIVRKDVAPSPGPPGVAGGGAISVDGNGNWAVTATNNGPVMYLENTTPSPGGGVLYLKNATGANQIISFSSARWKENIRPLTDSLAKVLGLRGVYFDWTKEYGGAAGMGFIAEEVGQFVPEVVEYEKNGVDAVGLDYAHLTPVLVEAIKEQQKQIEELRALVCADHPASPSCK